MYKRRIKIFLGLMALAFLGFAGRLVDLQIVHGKFHRREAEKLMHTAELLPAMRGRILDRKGKILAMDEPCYDLCLDYRFLTADSKWIDRQCRRIARGEGISKDQARGVYRRRSNYTWRLVQQAQLACDVDVGLTEAQDLLRSGGARSEKLAAEVGRKVRKTVASIIRYVTRVRRHVGKPVREQRQPHAIVIGLGERIDLAGTVGASVGLSRKRMYPYRHLACQVIGYMGPIFESENRQLNLKEDEADWLTRMRSNYLPGDAIGKTGVEKMCERRLRGLRGYRQLRFSGPVRMVVEQAAAGHGRDVHLTLDIELQKELTKAFPKGRTGCIVVLSIARSEVLAMVSMPTFDLNHYGRDYSKLVGEEVNRINLPLLNRCAAARYPPGSTVKPLVALAGLASGVISTKTTFHCRGYLHKPDAFRCWIWKYRRGHGSLNVTEALKHSCNIFFYRTGQRLGARLLGEWFRNFGLGAVPGTGLPEERGATVPTEDWLGRKYNRRFRPSDARFMAVGQGLVTTTPLQVANSMAAIARGARFRSPVLCLEDGPAPVRRDLAISGSNVRAVQLGMWKVVNERGGTAYKVFNSRAAGGPLGIKACGKTGTAEVSPQRIDSNGNGRIDRGDRIVREGDMAWFAGFAPYPKPQIALAVVVEYVKTGGGAANAGPVARKVLTICRKHGYIR